MQMIKKQIKEKVRKKVAGIAFMIIRPLIVPIVIIGIFVTFVSGITDILYIGFDNDDKVDMKKELAYYDTEYDAQRDKNEVKGFFESVWDFVKGIFGGMSTETDWPVERLL